MKTGSEYQCRCCWFRFNGDGSGTVMRARRSVHLGADLNVRACETLKIRACGVSDNAAVFAENWMRCCYWWSTRLQVKQILFGDNGVARHLKPGTVVMVSSTIASADAQEIATAPAAFDLDMLDAPVSGGAIKAADGK